MEILCVIVPAAIAIVLVVWVDPKINGRLDQ